MKNIIFWLLCGVITLFSCNSEVLVENPVLSNGESMTSLPDFLIGSFSLDDVGSLSLMIDGLDVFELNGNIGINLRKAFGEDELIFYNFKENLTQSAVPKYDGRKLKLYKKNDKVFINIPTTKKGKDYWNFIIVEKSGYDSIKLVIAEFDSEHFERNKSYYKSNSNFVKYIVENRGGNTFINRALVLDYYNETEFFDLLNDRDLFKYFFFEKD